MACCVDRWTLFLGILLALGASSLPSAAASAGVTLDLHYQLGSDFVGEASGSCQAGAAFLGRGTAGALTFDSAGGLWEGTTVEFNRTKLTLPGGWSTSVGLTQHVVRDDVEVPAGRGRLTWPGIGRAEIFATRGLYTNVTQAFPATFESSRLTTGVVQAAVPSFTYYVEQDVVPNPHFGSVQGPYRTTSVHDGRIHFSGDVTLYLEGAFAIFSDGSSVVVPMRNETVLRQDLAGVGDVAATRIHYATLTLSNVDIEVPSDGVTLLCADLAVTAEGTLQAYQASGRIQGAGSALEFNERELTLAGRFQWADSSHAEGVDAHASGQLERVSLDFLPAGPDLGGLPFLARAGLWTAALALLGSLLYYGSKAVIGMFTRFDQEAVLEHGSRRLVLESARQAPNITLHGLVSATGITKSEVRYHARVLERQGHLRSHKVHRDRCFVARDTIREEGRALLRPNRDLAARNDPVLGAVLKAVPADGVRLNHLLLDVVQKLDVSRPGAWKAVLRAEKYGYIRRDRQGKEVWVRCAS